MSISGDFYWNFQPKFTTITNAHLVVTTLQPAIFMRSLGTGHKLEGEGLVQTWGGPLFFMQHKKEGQTIWCMSLREGGGHYFLCKVAGVQESI